jgi:hypothetical protein
MDQFARRPAAERAEAFEETASRRGIGRPAIVEKDFWVCWVLLHLRELFGQSANEPRADARGEAAGLVFKGGTSLSKVYGVIRRFSEDIDLTIDRATLGLGTVTNADARRLSNSQQKNLLDSLKSASGAYIAEKIVPLLTTRLAGVTEVTAPKTRAETGVEIDPGDPQTLRVAYPRALQESAYASAGYVRSEVRLEFGARGELWPAHRATVRSYVAEEFDALLGTPDAEVNVLDLSRTLWEKATILHELAHAGISESRDRVSRHYYDLAELVRTHEGQAALAQTDLLDRVAEHKSIFHRRAKARYDLARAGTLILVPPAESLEILRRDYAAMKEMFFGAPPLFDDIIQTLRETEVRINAGASAE